MCTKLQLTGTKQLKELFPELTRTDRFKQCIDRYLAAVKPELHITMYDQWHCVKMKSGRQYKVKIENAKGEAFYLKRTNLSDGCIGKAAVEANPHLYRNVTASDSKHWMNGVETPMVNAEYESVQKTFWAEIALRIGKLIKNEIAYVQNCGKCNGTGFIPQFAHYAEGVCFDCMGVGKSIELTGNK